MKLFQKVVEGGEISALISFCWKDQWIGTILVVTVPVQRARYEIYFRIRQARKGMSFRHRLVFHARKRQQNGYRI